MYTANAKRQFLSGEFLKNRKWADKNSSKQFLGYEKLRETTNLCVEIMNSKQQVKGKLSHVVQIHVCRLM